MGSKVSRAKGRYALAVRREFYLPPNEIGKAGEPRATEFFVRLQVEEGSGGGRPNADEAAVRVVELDLDPPFKQGPVEQLTVFLPVGRADAPHEFDRAFRGADLEELKNFVQLLIELDRSSSRNSSAAHSVHGPAIHSSIAFAMSGLSSSRSFRSKRGGAFSGSPRLRGATRMSSDLTSALAKASSRRAVSTVTRR